jgi:hypothetical protein
MQRPFPCFKPILTRAAVAGFSLMEVLLIIGMLSVTILPFTLVMTQTAGSARGSYLQSSRSILLSSLMDEASVDRNYFQGAFHMSANNTNVSESGQVIPVRRVVDTDSARTDAFKKTVYFYLYNNNADAATAARYKTKMVYQRDTFRTRFANFTTEGGSNHNAWVDSSGFFWNQVNNYQEGGNSTPGKDGLYSNWSTGTDIVNTTADTLYQQGIYASTASLTYRAPVSNGLYTVKLYFVENGVTNRLMDITMEGNLMNPDAPYNAYAACGGRHFCGNVQMFDVAVSDGTLDVVISPNTGPSVWQDPFISGISVKKRI